MLRAFQQPCASITSQRGDASTAPGDWPVPGDHLHCAVACPAPALIRSGPNARMTSAASPQSAAVDSGAELWANGPDPEHRLREAATPGHWA
jgi:hypothetical protein